MGVSLTTFLLLTLFSLLTSTTAGHNITAVLAAFPQYSSFNSYLSQTKLSDEINNRKPITVLALTDSALAAVVSKEPLPVIKHVLSLHILLDYFDGPKLHKLSDGTALSTTLYQTTGEAQGQVGFVNITDKKGGKVYFGSGVPGSPLNSTYTKEVKKFPYSLSVIEISQPIIAPGVITAPAPSASDVNMTSLLISAGCKTFASLIVSTGVIKTYQTAAEKGLTVFAPSDEGFKAKDIPDLSKLTNAQLVLLLEYHALASYSPVGTLKSAKAPLITLAKGGTGKYDISVTTDGDEVTLRAGLDSSRLAMTVIDTTPLCIYKVDSVLLPAELFGNATSPVSAPGTSPETAPTTAPAPVVKSPSPSLVPSKSPAPVLSPPAPPAESPVGVPYGSPSDAPSEVADSSSESAPGDGKAVVFVKALVAVAVMVVCSFFMS